MAYIKEVRNKKGVTYQVNIRHQNYKPVYKTFWDVEPSKAKKAAKLWAKEVELQMDKGTYKVQSAAPELENIKYVKDLIIFFKTNIAPNKYAHLEKYYYVYDWWIDELGHIKIIDLSPSHLAAAKQKLINEKIKKGKNSPETTRSANTVNKYLMIFSAVLTWAVKEAELISSNPMSNISTLKKPDGRKRFLSVKEIQKLHKGCKEHSLMIYVFFLISLFTGGRFNEVRHLTIETIDFQNNQVFFLDTKNNESRGVYINENVMKIVKEYIESRHIESGYIFISEKKKGVLADIKGILEDIIKEQNIKDFHIHDIRHTTASYIAMNGGSLLDIAEILGHKSLVMARRYSHLTKKHTEKVLHNASNKMLPEL